MSEQWTDTFRRDPEPNGPSRVALGIGWYFDEHGVHTVRMTPDGPTLTTVPNRFLGQPGDVLRIEVRGTAVRVIRNGAPVALRVGRALPRHRRGRLRLATPQTRR